MKIDYYKIRKPTSPYGIRKQYFSLADRFWKNVEKTDNCWLWQGILASNGYGFFSIERKYKLAHRVAYEIQNGEILIGLLVCHTCDNRLCVRGSHLFTGTSQDNENDKHAKHRGVYGSKSPNAKLTEIQVSSIRSERLNGLSLNILAQKYGVSKKLILLIIQRKIWKHI